MSAVDHTSPDTSGLIITIPATPLPTVGDPADPMSVRLLVRMAVKLQVDGRRLNTRIKRLGVLMRSLAEKSRWPWVRYQLVHDNDDTMTAGILAGMAKDLPPHDVIPASPGGKVAAYNAPLGSDMVHVVLALSDDWACDRQAWDVDLLREYLARFPDCDGLLMFRDGLSGHKIPTAPLMGWRLIRRLGYILPPWYKAFWCDNELLALASGYGSLARTDESFGFRHCHWSASDDPFESLDALAIIAGEHNDSDRELYLQQRAVNFGVPSTAALDICINTTPLRRDSARRIVTVLQNQLDSNELWRSARLLISVAPGQKSGGPSLGTRRNQLLDIAACPDRWRIRTADDPWGVDTPSRRKSYVCFVDDDDDVSDDYVKTILDGINLWHDRYRVFPDCVALKGWYYARGNPPELFVHDLAYNGSAIREWVTVRDERGNLLHLRTPNHLNAVRSDIAVRARFDDIGHGEDRTYSKRLLPLLNTIVPVPGVLYHYHYDCSKDPEYVV
jgi:hypothetical protein